MTVIIVISGSDESSSFTHYTAHPADACKGCGALTPGGPCTNTTSGGCSSTAFSIIGAAGKEEVLQRVADMSPG